VAVEPDNTAEEVTNLDLVIHNQNVHSAVLCHTREPECRS
jgi:hypothetical protein